MLHDCLDASLQPRVRFRAIDCLIQGALRIRLKNHPESASQNHPSEAYSAVVAHR